MPRLLEQLGRAFASSVRTRGAAYIRRVHIIRSGPAGILAAVQGSSRYEVRIAQRGVTLEASCDCPYALEGEDLCKHAWATLCVAEIRGELAVVARNPRGVMPARRDGTAAALPRDDDADDGDHDDDDDDDEDDDDDDEPDEEDDAEDVAGADASPVFRRGGPWTQPVTQVQRGPRLLSPLPGGPSWPRLLSEVGEVLGRRARRVPWPATRRILYVFDMRASADEGSLVVDTYAQDPRRGGWTKATAIGVPRELVSHLPEPADRRILTLLGEGPPLTTPAWGPLGERASPRRILGLPVPLELIQAMCATGRARVRPAEPKAELVELAWDDGDPFLFELRLGRAGQLCVLEGALRRGSEVVPLHALDLAAPGLLFRAGKVARLGGVGVYPWIAQLRRVGVIKAPGSDLDGLLSRLTEMPTLPPLVLSGDLGLTEERGTPAPRVRIAEPKGARYDVPPWSVSLQFRYGAAAVEPGAQGELVYDPAGRRMLHRDAVGEDAARAVLSAHGATERRVYAREGTATTWTVTSKAVPAFVRGLLEVGWSVEVDGRESHRAGAIRLAVTSGIDWFDLDGVVEFGEQVASLPDLLAAVRRGDAFVPLGDGSKGILPEDWLQENGLLFGLARAEDGKLRFRLSQAGLLDVLLAAQPAVRWDEGFQRVREELVAFQRVEPGDPPEGFAGTLREYQRQGLGWMAFLRRFGFGGCLADDMGLGKTVQVLALLLSRKRELARVGTPRPSLVVVPRSVVFNWQAEAARFVPELAVLNLAGDRATRAAARLEAHDLLLTTYGLLRRDAARLGGVHFDYAILDEAQAIKNPGSVAAKAARLLEADHRLALSGTPIENHIGELWSLFEFLNPGLLGTASAFRGVTGRHPDGPTRDHLSRALRPFILRRTKAQVAADLPPRVEQTLWCELGDDERASYDELRDHYRRSLLGRIDRQGLAASRMHVLEALLRLRQAALHPGLLDSARADQPSAKLTMLLEQLDDVREQGAKALVFSQFTSLLDLVEPALDAAGIRHVRLDGKTRDRAAVVDRFRTDPACPVFLVSLKAGGLGLNLVEAQYVFLLDPWWNPAVEAQAIDRAHRIGQTRTVFAYRLVARQTIEEKILELQAKKRALADAILGTATGSATLRGLTRDDVELLLSG